MEHNVFKYSGPRKKCHWSVPLTLTKKSNFHRKPLLDTFSRNYYHTAKTQYRKFETNNPRKGTARLQSQFQQLVSASDLYIPLIGLSILLQEKRWADHGNIWIAHTDINAKIGTEAAQFLFWEYINSNFFAVQVLLIAYHRSQERSTFVLTHGFAKQPCKNLFVFRKNFP